MAQYTGAAFKAITPSDTTRLGKTIGFHVGTGGDVVLRANASSAAVTLKNVQDGQSLPFAAEYVMAATTAADIVAAYR